MMKDDIKLAKRVGTVVVVMLIALPFVDWYTGNFSIFNTLNRLFPTYLAIGAWHLLRDADKGLRPESHLIVTWPSRYWPFKK